MSIRAAGVALLAAPLGPQIPGLREAKEWVCEAFSAQNAGETVEDDFVCEWLDQQSVRDQLHFEQTPSPLRVWVTQENLWAYLTLLDVIAATNQSVGADRQSNAAVHVIESLEVGQPAAEQSRTHDRIMLDDAVKAAGAILAVQLPAGAATTVPLKTTAAAAR